MLERLPNIRSLWLNDGLRFNEAYTETPLCCPSRATFLTGQHTRRHGVVRQRARLLDPSMTIATTLDGAGYYTAMVGKYLNHSRALPDKSPPGWDRVALLSWMPRFEPVSRWWVDDVEIKAPENDDRLTLQLAVDWLREAPANDPLFMWVNPRAPHWSTSADLGWRPEVEPRYASDPRCDGIEPWKPPTYDYPVQPNGYPLGEICRSLLTVDEMVGDMRAAAAAQGRDPIWVFLSDNGMAWGRDGYPQKNVPQASRFPMYVAGPGVVSGSTDALVSNIDIAPTLAALGGVDMPEADGVSFTGVLGGGDGRRDWMLEDHPLSGATYGPIGKTPWWGVRTRDWHLVKVEGMAPRLYDLRADPWETTDVSADNPWWLGRLRDLAAPYLYPLTEPPALPVPTRRPSAPVTNAEPTPAPTAGSIGVPAGPTTGAPTPTRGPTPSPAPTPIPLSTPGPTPIPLS